MIRTGFKPRTTPMARGSVSLKARKPKAAKPKRAAREATDKHLADMCHGQPCYLRIDACCMRANSVPCHSNQSIHGKGMSIKAAHRFTVPGCDRCHFEIDQGKNLTKQEKFAIWDAAYAVWEPVRDQLQQSRHTGQ